MYVHFSTAVSRASSCSPLMYGLLLFCCCFAAQPVCDDERRNKYKTRTHRVQQKKILCKCLQAKVNPKNERALSELKKKNKIHAVCMGIRSSCGDYILCQFVNHAIWACEDDIVDTLIKCKSDCGYVV